MKITIDGEYIDLQSLLKLATIAPTGGFAKILIQNDCVYLNGNVENRRKKKIYRGDIVLIRSDQYDLNEKIEVK